MAYNSSMPCRIGCSGYFYRHWRGRFYPPEMPMNRWFAHYASHFDTVEINASFYRFPTRDGVRRWKRQAPAGFVYAVKAPRVITHLRRFHHCDEEMARFSEVLHELGSALGMTLFQMPPGFRFSEQNLERIMAALPSGLPCALEFRHISWWNDAVWRACEARGALFCSVHAPELPDEIVPVSGRIYLRFHGIPWYRHDYSDEELAAWAARIRASHAGDCWIYFNNDMDAAAPRNALTLAAMLAGEDDDAH